ncbi:MAG: hypothetical protein WCH34_18810 [Bacteroidota bacterium]
MKARHQRHFDAKLRLQDFCVIHNNALSNIFEYPVLIVLLNLIISKIQAAVAINKTNLKHIASNKDVLQKVMIDTVWRYQLRARVFARTNNLTKIYQALKYEKTYISANDDATVADKAEEIMKIIKSNLSHLIYITLANITEMETSILNYRNVLLSPEEAIKDRKSTGTDLISAYLKEADIITNDIGDLVESYLEDLYPDWLIRAKIGKPTGTRHQSIKIKYLDADTETPLKKVKITLTNASGTITHTFYSTKRGWITIYSLQSGNWTIISEFQNYITDIKTNVGVFDKKTIKFEIKLHTTIPPSITPEPPTPEPPITPTPIPETPPLAE